MVVKIFLWVSVNHENYSLKHFQQQNNSRQKFLQTMVITLTTVTLVYCDHMTSQQTAVLSSTILTQSE